HVVREHEAVHVRARARRAGAAAGVEHHPVVDVHELGVGDRDVAAVLAAGDAGAVGDEIAVDAHVVDGQAGDRSALPADHRMAGGRTGDGEAGQLEIVDHAAEQHAAGDL